MNSLKKYTSELNKYFKQIGVTVILLSIVSIILWFLYKIGVGDNLHMQGDYTKREFMPILISAIIALTFIVSISGIYYLKKLTLRIIEILEGKSNLRLKHSNGDEIIFYKDIILYDIGDKKKGEVKISGVSYDKDNLKDLALDLIKNDFSFASLIPNVTLSSNKIKTFMITLNRHQKLSLGFLDLDNEKMLIISHEVPQGIFPANKTHIAFPLEDKSINFNKNEFDSLCQKLNKFCNVSSNYISQDLVDEFKK